MTIYLCYGYRPNTTAVYFERALSRLYDVYYVGPGYGAKPGYAVDSHLQELTAHGLPKPDLVLFIESGIPYFPRGLETIDCPTACYLIDVHQGRHLRALYARFFDYVFVAQKDYVGYYRQNVTAHVEWMPLACDPEIHGHSSTERKIDVGFVGNINSTVREAHLRALSRNCTMNDWRRVYPKEEIGKIYSQSRIVFNRSIRGDLNMRVFEAMCSGAALLTDDIGNGMSDLFIDGQHLVTYRDGDDVAVIAEALLSDESRRAAIADAGFREVLARHTYAHRCAQILNTVFERHPGTARANARDMSSRDLRRAYGDIWAMMRVVDPALTDLAKAWNEHAGVSTAAMATGKALTRRLNAIIKITPRLRRVVRSFRSHSEYKTHRKRRVTH